MTVSKKIRPILLLLLGIITLMAYYRGSMLPARMVYNYVLL